MSGPLVLVLGGTRSGKSTYGMERAIDLAGGGAVVYLATARRGDPELEQRIVGHRQRRPAEWPTVLVPDDLAGTISSLADDDTILLDGLTLWLSATADTGAGAIDTFLAGRVEPAIEVMEARTGACVVVSDEIGLGLVPMDGAAREFRDLIGLVHQRLARSADEVHFMIAGLPMRLKPAP